MKQNIVPIPKSNQEHTSIQVKHKAMDRLYVVTQFNQNEVQYKPGTKQTLLK